jgi:hypothetical protein
MFNDRLKILCNLIANLDVPVVTCQKNLLQYLQLEICTFVLYNADMIDVLENMYRTLEEI